MSGTTRSSDWRLRSTTHSTSPSRATIGSTIASHTAPSSSSASPSSAIWRPPRGHVEVPGDVAMGQRAPDRRGGSDPYAPGRVVDGVGILRAARIGLKAPVLAQARQVRGSRRPSRKLIACRTGEACGLTDTRSGASRCANHSAVISETIDALEAWWPPTLIPLGFRPHAVGVVDDGGGQPQDAALDLVEDVEVGLRSVGAGLHRGHHQSFARP